MKRATLVWNNSKEINIDDKADQGMMMIYWRRKKKKKKNIRKEKKWARNIAKVEKVNREKKVKRILSPTNTKRK